MTTGDYCCIIIKKPQRQEPEGKRVDDMWPDFPRIDVYKTGRNIRRMMLEQGMTVRDIQEYLRLSASQSIYHWFSGKSLPTVDNLYALSELFHVPVDMLICGNREVVFGFREHSDRGRLRAYYEKCLELRAG